MGLGKIRYENWRLFYHFEKFANVTIGIESGCFVCLFSNALQYILGNELTWGFLHLIKGECNE